MEVSRLFSSKLDVLKWSLDKYDQRERVRVGELGNLAMLVFKYADLVKANLEELLSHSL